MQLESLSEVLSEIGNLGQGTLATLTIKKKGVLRGSKGSKVAYGNDKVQVLLWTGFHYKALVERSYSKLQDIWGEGNFLKSLLTAVRAAGHPEVTLKDVTEAVLEINDSLLRSSEEVIPGADENWKPLKVKGIEIKGAKVYKGPGGSTLNSPVKGNIYLSGVKLGEKILEEAPPWKANQKAKTVAKNILRSWLPVGLYVQYCLDPENLQNLQVGEKASGTAKAAQILIDPEAVRSLFKIAI